MKNKKITKFISFLLVLVVLFSMPLNLQANAIATESWMVYALITYLAGMGITFTVAGGVNAMIQAMEEKVNDYEQANNIIDFYEYLRNRSVRLVPNNNQDPDGNPFFDLFFTASAVEAIQSFANWLTSEGGWTGEISYSSKYIEALTEDGVVLLSDGYASGLAERIPEGRLGELFTYQEIESISLITEQGVVTFDFWAYSNGVIASCDVLLDGELWNTFNLTNAINENDKFTFGIRQSYGGTDSSVPYLLKNPVQYDGYYSAQRLFGLWVNNKMLNYIYLNVDSRIDIMTPEELQEQFPSVDQGVSISDAISVPMGDPTLTEWAQRMEEIFDLTGTIPQPVPEVVPDPELAPLPTPVPTPVPSPEIEDIDDLGLPTLGEAIFSKFPFSLPKDIGRIFALLSADPVTPYWEVDLTGDALGIPSNFVIDFAPYEVLGQISRWFSVISFCLFLILITRGMIKW